MYLYLDESGDLGFDFSKKGTSKYFVITILVCKDKITKRALSNAVKRTLKNKINHKKKNNSRQHELKAPELILMLKIIFTDKLKKIIIHYIAWP